MQKIEEEGEENKGWEKVNEEFGEQLEVVELIKREMEDFIMNMHFKTKNTIKKQKMRMVAKNIDSVNTIEEVKARVQRFKDQVENNKFILKTKEEMGVIQQETKDNEVYNYKLGLFLNKLRDKKEKEDSYQVYLNAQIRDRKVLYKSVNTRNIKISQELKLYKKELGRLK